MSMSYHACLSSPYAIDNVDTHSDGMFVNPGIRNLGVENCEIFGTKFILSYIKENPNISTVSIGSGNALFESRLQNRVHHYLELSSSGLEEDNEGDEKGNEENEREREGEREESWIEVISTREKRKRQKIVKEQKAYERQKKLDEKFKIICIDPSPERYSGETPLIVPQYKYTSDLIKERPQTVGNCILIINWAYDEGEYDFEAIKSLKPLGVLCIHENIYHCSGSWKFVQWYTELEIESRKPGLDLSLEKKNLMANVSRGIERIRTHKIGNEKLYKYFSCERLAPSYISDYRGFVEYSISWIDMNSSRGQRVEEIILSSLPPISEMVTEFERLEEKLQFESMLDSFFYWEKDERENKEFEELDKLTKCIKPIEEVDRRRERERREKEKIKKFRIHHRRNKNKLMKRLVELRVSEIKENRS